MKCGFRFLLLGLLQVGAAAAQQAAVPERKLFPFVVDGWWGYLNANGETVIPPRFRAAGLFSEGLAPVRPNGVYGYIDLDGHWAIPPQFDFAGAFRDSAAWVFRDAKPYLINRQGQKRFENTWKHIGPILHRKLIQAWPSDSTATLIDFNGRKTLTQVMDAPYDWPYIQNVGPLVFSDYWRSPAYRNGFRTAYLRDARKPLPPGGSAAAGWKEYVLDTAGRPVWATAANERLYPLGGGYFEVRSADGVTPEYAFVANGRGQRLFSIRGTIYPGIVNEGRVTVGGSLRDTSFGKKDPMYVADTQGTVVLRARPDWNYISPFSSHRAFVRTRQGWMLIGQQGQELNRVPYDSVFLTNQGYYPYEYSLPFQDGLAFVAQGGIWTAIDTNGRTIDRRPELAGIRMDELRRRDGVLLLLKHAAGRYCHPSVKGSWNPRLPALVLPRYCLMDTAHFADSLIAVCDTAHRWFYIDPHGRERWQEALPVMGKRLPVHIDFQYQSDYPATSMNRVFYEGADVTATDYRVLHPDLLPAPNACSLAIRPDDTAVWLGRYRADLLLIANTTPDTLFCNKQAYSLHLTLEARDEHGHWQSLDDEGDRYAWGMTAAYLPPGHYWRIAVPHFDGSFATCLRAKLEQTFVRDPSGKNDGWKKNPPLYSPELEVRINPGQLWRKRPAPSNYEGIDVYRYFSPH